MKIFKPFQEVTKSTTNMIQLGWLILIASIWAISSCVGTTHLFPTMTQVFTGLSDSWKEGLMVEIMSTLALFGKALLYSVIISLTICYLSPLPILKPVSNIISKLRYLPLTGLSFYIAILIQDARSIQVWVLVVYISTFLITSILGVLKDIPDEEFNHAKTIGCSRWEMLWEVVIKGRFDYIIEAIRINLAIAWGSIVAVESILVAGGGLGVLIKNGDKLGNQGNVVANQLIIILIGLLIDFLLTQGRKLTFKYSKF